MLVAFQRTHPELFALWLKDSIDIDYAKPLSSLVTGVGADQLPTGRLRKEFLQLTGCSALEYLTRRRVDVAMGMLRMSDDKMEIIARAVGWKSPKDLYRAVYDSTGKTPAEVRSESAGAVR